MSIRMSRKGRAEKASGMEAEAAQPVSLPTAGLSASSHEAEVLLLRSELAGARNLLDRQQQLLPRLLLQLLLQPKLRRRPRLRLKTAL